MSQNTAAEMIPPANTRSALACLLVALALVACSGNPTAPLTGGLPSPTESTHASTSPSPSPTPAPSDSAASAGFAPTGSTSVGRDGHTATLLSDGRVLVAGGVTNVDTFHPLSSAELYDPRNGGFSSTGSMSIPREMQTSTLLQDGRVLIAGGYDFDDFSGTGEAPPPGQATAKITSGPPDPRRIAELYDPKTGTFSRTGSMAVDRYGHTATLLDDGRVLIAGGQSLKSGGLSSAELYDPRNGTFTPTGSLNGPRTGHTATLLPDGDVLIVGGDSLAAELYHQATGKFSLTGSLSVPRVDHTATLLRDGRVLIAGGFAGSGDSSIWDASAEIYDPKTGTFSPTGSMREARTGHTATLLANGQVLITGGYDPQGGTAQKTPIMAELYDPAIASFSTIAGMYDLNDTATRLSDGRVLMTGGSIAVEGGSESLATAQLYRP